MLQDESIYLRKFSTFSNQSSISTVSNKTAHSEMVISEEEETDNADLDKQTTKTVWYVSLYIMQDLLFIVI